MSSLTYILGFSVRFFSASLFRLGILCDKNQVSDYRLLGASSLGIAITWRPSSVR